MFYISEEDIPRINGYLLRTVKKLGSGNKRVGTDVNLGDNLPSLVISGYWVGDVLRIDVKVAK